MKFWKSFGFGLLAVAVFSGGWYVVWRGKSMACAEKMKAYVANPHLIVGNEEASGLVVAAVEREGKASIVTPIQSVCQITLEPCAAVADLRFKSGRTGHIVMLLHGDQLKVEAFKPLTK